MKFFEGNEVLWRMLRTAAQGFVSVATVESVAYIIGGLNIDPSTKAILVPIIMTILSPITKKIGEWLNKKKEIEAIE